MTRFLQTILLTILLPASSGITPWAASAAEKKEWTRETDDPADRTACQRQLNLIYSAVMQYYRRHQDLPRWLSDLTPQYLHDPDLLVCPYVRKTGKQTEWRKDYLSGVWADPHSTYAYEFCLESASFYPGRTHRYFKQRQMELMGFSVPIVRCFAHRPILNLAFNGKIYESPDTFEDNFARTEAERPLFHVYIGESTQNEMVRKVIPPRPTQTSARMLDLTPHYNALLLHLSAIEFQGKLLVTFPEGFQKIDGVDFDIRGLVHLSARNFPISFPTEVEGIAVNRKCERIHFLHGTMFSAPTNKKIASYVVHFASGQTNEIPVTYGKHVKTRWFDAAQPSELENPKVAWRSPPDSSGSGGDSLRLYRLSWLNPTPEAEVKSITFVSNRTESAPFLVAISVEGDAPAEIKK